MHLISKTMIHIKSTKLILLLLFLTSVIHFAQTVGFHSNLKSNCKVCHLTEDENSTTFLAWQQDQNNNYYTAYSSQTLDANISQPSGSSKLCLSCHDGAMASEDSGNYSLEANQIIGSNLKTSHPISFYYDSYLAIKDRELHDPNSSPSGLGGTINKDMLIDGKLECISCHDVHSFSGQKNLLIKPNERSQLCLTCHNK